MGKNMEESIFLSAFPKNSSLKEDAELAKKWTEIRGLREKVLKALEEAREAKIIGSSLEARVTFKTSDETNKKFISDNLALLSEISIVSETALAEGGEGKDIEVVVEHALGEKCPRCWQWKTDIGTHKKHTDVCSRCADVLEKENIAVAD